MTALSMPRHPLITQALTDAQLWCAGRIIEGRPAFAHAAQVAVTLGWHHLTGPPELIAAALLHRTPGFAPPGTKLTDRYPAEVARIVEAVHAEHLALDQPDPDPATDLLIVPTGDRPVLLVSTADTIVALTSLARRAQHSGDLDAFLTARPRLPGLLDHARALQHAGIGTAPTSMSAHLRGVLDLLDHATATAGDNPGTVR